MLSAIGVWLVKQGAGVLLGFLSDFLVGLYKTYAANQAQRERGRNEAVAEAAEQQSREQAAAGMARADAEVEHGKHASDDDGFDKEFQRGA